MAQAHQVLVAPRAILGAYNWVTLWNTAEQLRRNLIKSARWCDRTEAERSLDLVQPIPCAVIRDKNGKYCQFRRIREAREDLRSRITLLIGGHIDRPANEEPLQKLFMKTLLRELEEEVGITDVTLIQPVALIIDSSSLLASRHIAFVHNVIAPNLVAPKAQEEFSLRSKFTGRFVTAEELEKLLPQLDPWSRLLFGAWIRPSDKRLGAGQRELAIHP